MPDFIPVLIAAILLFAVMLIAFGDWISASPTYKSMYNMTPSYTNNIHLGGDFSVSSGAGGKYVTYMSGIVASGLMSHTKKSITFNADGTGSSGGIIDLTVTNTNLYGPLTVKMNGNVLYSNYSRIGTHKIYFPKEYLEPQNILEVDAGSSGWRIWAPTVYIFKANVSIGYYSDIKKSFGFTVNQDEYDNLMNSYVISKISNYSGGGRPVYNVNNFEIYKGVGSNFTLPKDVLKVGFNNFTVSSESDTSFSIGTLDVVLNY